jgi:hypothetical protein
LRQSLPVLDPGRGRTKTGRLWVYAHEQRGWGGTDPPAAVYIFAPDRKAERPVAHLERVKGVPSREWTLKLYPLALLQPDLPSCLRFPPVGCPMHRLD